jgi:protein-S-isoprenylcysteine O-methyltransferase Ste14
MTTPLRDMRLTIILRVTRSTGGWQAAGSPGGWKPWAGRVFALIGALLFAAALSYFLYTYAFTFGERQQATAVGPAIAWDTVLFTLFALHHSLFARTRVRTAVARTVPAELERSVYVWIASLLFIAVCRFWRPVAGVAWSMAPPLGWLMYGMMAAGVFLSVKSAGVIDIWDLAGVRQVSIPNSQRPTPNAQTLEPKEVQGGPEFKTTGPYGLVRHPIYLGWFLMVFGVPLMTSTRLMFALVSCAYLLVAIPLEERTLRRTTDGRYDEYIRLVRWKLVPGIY